MILPFYLDWTILLIIPGIIVAIWAQARVKRAYNTYAKIYVQSNISGRETAERILTGKGINDVGIAATRGRLSDHYNPRKKMLNLSEANYSKSSIAAVAIAGHEAGHAIQHNEGYFPLKIRSLIAPVVSAASYLLWPIIILGFIAGFTQAIDIAVYIFVGIFVFQLITLPVEYNASRRAIAALVSQSVLREEEIYGAKKMLNAAALTYVAATLAALLNVIRFAALSRRR